MATKTVTTHHYICDLCGEERPKEEIATVYSERPAPGNRAYIPGSKQCDICDHCLDEPVSAVLAVLRREVTVDGP
jgi:hypothetical protein